MSSSKASTQPPVPVLHHPRAVLRLLAFFMNLIGTYLVYEAGRIVIKLCGHTPRYWREYFFGVWARNTLRILGVRLSILGTPPAPPAIQVSNHLGYLDIIVLAACGPSRFLSKVEVAAWPVIGPIVKSVDTLFIDRSNYRDLERISGEIAEVIAQGESITFFPEGTSHHGQEILPFRSPLLKMPAENGIAVCPIGITYSTTSPDYPAFRDVCWWDAVPFFNHLYRCCAVPNIHAVVNYNHEPVLETNRKQFAESLRSAIQRLTRP